MQILGKIAELLGHLSHRSNTMAADISTILAKLTEQGQQIAAQGQQIAKLVADRTAKEQADLQNFSDLLDANGKAIADNSTALAALEPDQSGTGIGAASGTADNSGSVSMIDPATGLPVVH